MIGRCHNIGMLSPSAGYMNTSLVRWNIKNDSLAQRNIKNDSLAQRNIVNESLVRQNIMNNSLAERNENHNLTERGIAPPPPPISSTLKQKTLNLFLNITPNRLE